MNKFFSSTIWGYPAWSLFIVIAGGAGIGFSYKFHQVTYIYPQAWQIYPLNLVIPNNIIGIILSLALWIGYCTFLSWISSKSIQTLLKIDSLSFSLFILMFGVSYLPVYFPSIIVSIFIALKILFFLISLPFREKILPQIKTYRSTLIDIGILSIFSAFIWLNTITLNLGRGINAHLSIKAAQLAKYFQYPAWNPEMYAGGWPFIYGQVYGYLWYWLIGFFPISPLLLHQFVRFETFLPMYFMIIFSSLSFYLLLKKSFQLSRAVSIFGGLIYLLNFYMQGIVFSETNCALAYLVFPSVFLVAERGLKNRNLLYASLSGLLINFLMPATYAHPESFYIFYFIIGAFYLLAAIFYYEKKNLFPIISLIIFAISHLVFLNYYLPIFEYMHVFKEAVHLAGETRLTGGFGPYVPLFYPFYIGVMPAFLIVYAFFCFRKIINKNFPTPFFLGIFSFLMFIFLSIAQLGKELPVYSLVKLPEKYIFPFVHFWMRFAPGLFFFHYIIACLGLDCLLKNIDESFHKFEFPKKVNTAMSKLTYYLSYCIKKIWVLISFVFLVVLMIVGKLYFRGGCLDKNFFGDPYGGGIRDIEFFWIYIIVGAAAMVSLLFINKRYLRLVVFFGLSVIPLIHYMEPNLQIFSRATFKPKLLHLKDIYSPAIKHFPAGAAEIGDDKQFFLPYIERNPRDTIALNAFNNYMTMQTVFGDAKDLLLQKLCFSLDKDFVSKINYLREKVLPLQDNFLKGYLSDKGFSRFMEIGKATDGFSFSYHMYHLANVIFNMGGNVGRPHQWRWFPQFDHFFPKKVCNDCAWYLEPSDLIGRFWTINLLGVKHLVISEKDYPTFQSVGVTLGQNLIKNSSFENIIFVPEGWELVGSGGSVKKGSEGVVTLFSGPMTAKDKEWELVQDVMKLTKDESMRGKSYVLGVWVKTSTPNSVRVLIRDYYSDKRSGYHSGSGEWEFLTVTKTIRQDAPVVEAILMIEEKNTAAQFDRPILLNGDVALEATLKVSALRLRRTKEIKRPRELTVEGEAFAYGRKILLLRNNSALPLMFLVNSYKLVNPALKKEEKWEALNQIDYRNAILLEEKPVLPQLELRGNRSMEDNSLDTDSVRIIDIRGNIAAARVNITSAYKYFFYSDNYHPGWVALIDGIPTKVYRADLAFKAIVVPEGEHLIWFEFRPMSLWIGIYISSLAILVIVVAASRRVMF